jgi:hypothetical protein
MEKVKNVDERVGGRSYRGSMGILKNVDQRVLCRLWHQGYRLNSEPTPWKLSTCQWLVNWHRSSSC